MNDRDIRAVENMARTGMGFEDLRKAFSGFPIEEVEKIYTRVHEEHNDDPVKPQSKMNCS